MTSIAPQHWFAVYVEQARRAERTHRTLVREALLQGASQLDLAHAARAPRGRGRAGAREVGVR